MPRTRWPRDRPHHVTDVSPAIALITRKSSTERFERYLGIKVAAFEVEGYRPRDELVYVMFSEVGQQVSRFALRNDRTMFLFTFAEADPDYPHDTRGQKAVLRKRFARSGWECPKILEALDAAHNWYFDRVSQICIDGGDNRWARGRVVLVGDAAVCISLLGGQGSALGMAAAYILAGELRRARGRHDEAFAAYQRRFGSFVSMKQRAARRFAGAFAPRSSWSLFLRNEMLRLLSIEWLAKVAAGREFADRMALPDY